MNLKLLIERFTNFLEAREYLEPVDIITKLENPDLTDIERDTLTAQLADIRAGDASKKLKNKAPDVSTDSKPELKLIPGKEYTYAPISKQSAETRGQDIVTFLNPHEIQYVGDLGSDSIIDVDEREKTVLMSNGKTLIFKDPHYNNQIKALSAANKNSLYSYDEVMSLVDRGAFESVDDIISVLSSKAKVSAITYLPYDILKLNFSSGTSLTTEFSRIEPLIKDILIKKAESEYEKPDKVSDWFGKTVSAKIGIVISSPSKLKTILNSYKPNAEQ